MYYLNKLVCKILYRFADKYGINKHLGAYKQKCYFFKVQKLTFLYSSAVSKTVLEWAIGCIETKKKNSWARSGFHIKN